MKSMQEDDDDFAIRKPLSFREWAALIGTTIAVVAVGAMVFFATPSKAADKLGGDCCADLEERIAELEATTVQKGNRKVSLTVSGWVAEQVTYWNDGTESNVYVGGIGRTLASHVKFTGEANINPDLSAGYVLHLEAIDNDPLAWNQDGTGALSNAVEVQQSFWFLKSKTLGKVSVGRQSTSADNAALTVDQSGSLVPANWVMFDGAGFFLRSGGVRVDQALANLGSFGPITIGVATDRGLTWGNQLAYCNTGDAGIGGDCAGVPLQAVRYDSPVFKGFTVSASWAENDYWDAALRYSGEIESFKLAAAAAFSRTSDGGVDSNYAQIGVYVEHIPTGLFVYGAYGREDNSGFNTVSGDILLSATLGPVTVGPIGIPFSVPVAAGDSDNWYLKGGARERWTPLGHTVVYVEYGQHNDQLGPELRLVGATDSKLTQFGVGIVQEIDAAAMSLWLKYRRMDGEASAAGGTVDFDAIDFVGAGALIVF